MLRLAYNYLAQIPAIFLDGAIYVALAVISAWLSVLTSDTARELIGPTLLFWISSALSSTNAGLLALKMFRSTAFADHRQDKKDSQAASILNSNKVNQGKTDDIKSF